MLRPLSLLLSVCGVALAPASGAVADAKIYHGSQCRPSVMAASDAPADYFKLNPSQQDGPASGQVTLSGYLDCPIVRDATGNTNGLQAVEVNIIAGDAPGQAECTLSALSAEGLLLASQARSTTVTSTLEFGSTLNASDALGYYHLSCRMPPGWSLARYAVTEYGSGNDGAPGAAATRDAKYYNAAEWCFPSERSRRAQGGYFGYPPDGYTTRDPLTCPIIRDDTAGHDGLAGVELSVIGPGDSTATCTVHAVAADGSFLQSESQSTSSMGMTTLVFGAAGHLGASGRAGASYYLDCSFSTPKDWILKGYRVLESASSDEAAPSVNAPVSGDRKTYTGSFCRPNLMDTFDKSYFWNVSGYYYQVTETPPLLCPLLRDVTNNDDGLADIEIWVSAPGRGSVGCGLYMLNAEGTIVGQGSRGIEFGPEGGVKKLDFSSPGAAIDGKGTSADQGAFGISCALPKGFAIIGYMVEEHRSGDSD